MVNLEIKPNLKDSERGVFCAFIFKWDGIWGQQRDRGVLLELEQHFRTNAWGKRRDASLASSGLDMSSR